MPFEIREEKSYEQKPDSVYNAALKAVAGLEGTLLKQNPAGGQFEARFNKTILGKVLGDRTHLAVNVTPRAEAGSLIAIEAYPLDAVGRKLMFGARKGVTQTVTNWFFAHLEHNLGK